MSGVIRFIIIAIILPCGLFGKPAYHLYRNNAAPATSNTQQSSSSTADSSFRNLQNDVDNHEIELRMLEERINAQEIILEALRKQFVDTSSANKQMFKGGNSNMEMKLSKVEANEEAIIKDIRGLQTHSNDTAKALSQYKQKISELESHLGKMKESLDTIYTALQIEDPVKGGGGSNIYQVKAGDRLEKIAKEHNTTISKIKALNNLNTDKIFIGQKLKLP